MRIPSPALEALYHQAMADFPVGPLTMTTDGDSRQVGLDSWGFCDAVVFPAQPLGGMFIPKSRLARCKRKLIGWGIVEAAEDNGMMTISGMFDILRDGDWDGHCARFFRGERSIWGSYTPETHQWDFWVSR